MNGRQRELWLLRAACFFQIFSFGIQWSFSGVWMRDQGLGESLIGAVWSTSIFLWFLTGLVWGRVADRTGRTRDIVRAGCVLQAVALVYLSFCSTPASFFVYAVIAGISQPMVTTLMPLLVVTVLGSRARGRSYASYRVFGSIGYILANLVVPRLVADTPTLFWAGAASQLLALLPLIGIGAAPRPGRRSLGVGAVLARPQLAGFLMAIFFFALALPAVFTFTTVYARELDADTAFIGLLMASQGLVALVGLPLIGWGVDRFGTRALLLTAFIAMPLRALALSFVTGYRWLLVPQVFHFFTWAGLEVSGVLFVTGLVGPGSKATAQSMYMGAQVLGQFLGAAAGGYAAEHFGYVIMYRLASLLSVVGLVIHLVVQLRIRKAEKRRRAGQAVRQSKDQTEGNR